MMPRAVLCLLLAASLHAQVQCSLKCRRDPCEYRMGEPIEIELAFTSSQPGRYSFYRGGSDFTLDEIRIAPSEGVVDPLRAWSYGMSYCGGWGSLDRTPPAEPVVVPLELTERRRFDRPGLYRLAYLTRRTVDKKTAENLDVPTNEVELRILPVTPEWQAAELASILSEMETSKTIASHRLRLLGSEAAAREMARRLRGEDHLTGNELRRGLASTPHPAAAREEMERLLADPDFPVTTDFVLALAFLSVDPSLPEEEFLQERAREHVRLMQSLASLVAVKRGRARAVTADLAVNAPGFARAAKLELLLELFNDLPVSPQLAWLQTNWRQVGDPRWLPILRHISTLPASEPDWQSASRRAWALRRWYELDPAGARPAVLAEIADASSRVAARELTFLRDQTLPEIEPDLVAALKTAQPGGGRDRAAALIERYATRDVLPEVQPILEEMLPGRDCEPVAVLLAYVLRVDPDNGVPLLDRALTSSDGMPGGCRIPALDKLGRLRPDLPGVEKHALAALDDPDPAVVVAAAHWLGSFGSAAAEPVLWSHLEQALAKPAVSPTNRFPEQAFVTGLLYALSWNMDEARLKRLAALSAGRPWDYDATSRLASVNRNPPTIYISWDDSATRYYIASYSTDSLDYFKRKIRTLPKGTAIAWGKDIAPVTEAEFKLLDDLSQWATAQGYALPRFK
ncbi:MAG: hypothetical protein HY858_15740 [Candidatus Solibacter usitatus]|nr:hypothetical protein [Candidatus Solibacter usitatus]